MADDAKSIASASTDFLQYCNSILRPAADELSHRLYANDLRLHHVFQVNLLAAHLMDYLAAIRRATGVIESRQELVEVFDDIYAVEGAIYLNRKFQLVDAVNNALKHIQLNKNRYSDLVHKYGDIGFRCLCERDGLIFFEAKNHRFDFARVVLRPVLETVTNWTFEGAEDVVDFALGKYATYGDGHDEFEDDDAIDQMINYCNPICLDCGEGGKRVSLQRVFVWRENRRISRGS